MSTPIPFDNRRAPVYGRYGMACSSTPLAAVIGRDVLQAGGNAADAALAMAAVVNVTEPMMSGLGGDMFAIVWKDGKAHGLNASGFSGSLMTLERVRAEYGDNMPQAGAATINVPGALDGYLELHKQFGTMDLADLFEHAAKLVDDGFPVGAKISQAWAAGAPLLRKYSPDSTAYLPGGQVPTAGSIFREQDLARLWRRIGREGRAAFYSGGVRDRIVETVQKVGGYLQAGDFDAIQAEWVEPIHGSYRGHTILEMPPNGQGIVALEALAILEGYDMAAIFAADEVQACHLILEAIKLAYADAAATVADARFLKAPIENLLDPEYIKQRRAALDRDHASDNPPAGRVFGDTTYLTVVDRDRMAVSLITSISGPFGSGIVVPGIGVVMNNRLADFVLVPGHPNAAAPADKSIGSWEVLNYLLANCSSVDEAVAALQNDVYVAQQEFVPFKEFLAVHYWIGDSTGKVVIAEYVGGKLTIHDAPLGTLTNSPPYNWQEINVSNYVDLSPVNVPERTLGKFTAMNYGQGSGAVGLPGDMTPPSRFVRAALFSHWATPGATASDTVNLGFHVLNTFDIFNGAIQSNTADQTPNTKGFLTSAGQPKLVNTDTTEWAVAHDRTNLKTYVRTYNGLEIQVVDLKAIDFGQPGMRVIALQNDFVPEDITLKVQPLAAKAE